MKTKRVGVLMGGPSPEREISIRSGRAVCNALLHKGIEVIPVELARPESIMNGYEDAVKDMIKNSSIDIAFIALHGEFGEDGKIQKIMEELRIPYTGSSAESSERGMDKIRSKEIFRSKHIPVAKDEVLTKAEFEKGCKAMMYFEKLGPQLVIKPYNCGSSIGMSIIDTHHDFHKALEAAFTYAHKVLIEEYIAGRELTVGILDDKALPVIEIVSNRLFFDFKAKYEKGNTDYIVPARLSHDEELMCQDMALRAHRALEARYFSRVDMILTKIGVPCILELNTIPGLTDTSLLPKAAQATGIDFGELCLKILESALW